MSYWPVWICLFMCFGIQAQVINMKDRILVAMAGETLHLKIDVTLPANHSAGNGNCYGPQGQTVSSFEFPDSSAPIVMSHGWAMSGLNGSDSGRYVCQYKHAQVYWVVLVKDRLEPIDQSNYDKRMIAIGAVNLGLVFFSVVGSIYVFKGHGDRSNVKDRRSGGEERREELEEEEGGGRTPEKASVYASLEQRPASIYNVLHPAEDPEMSETKPTTQRARKSWADRKPQEDDGDGVFESVYENV